MGNLKLITKKGKIYKVYGRKKTDGKFFKFFDKNKFHQSIRQVNDCVAAISGHEVIKISKFNDESRRKISEYLSV